MNGVRMRWSGPLGYIITTQMEAMEIKEELSKFINLLQSDYKPSSVPLDDRRNDYHLSKKLSIILSASEPESSSLDKENSNPSANRSFESDRPLPARHQAILDAFSAT